MHYSIQETWAMTRRWLHRLRREPMSITFSILQPLIWLLLFGNLFQRAAAIPGVESGRYLSFMTAGVVVMTVLNSGLFGGVEIMFDKETGFLERLLVAPIHRSALIVSRFLYVIGITSIQSLLILGLASLLSVPLATGIGGLALILAIGMMLGIGLIALSTSLAFVVKGHGPFFALIGFITLPLIFLSSALVPRSVMPGWMSLLALLNPMTYAIEGVRSLILAGWVWPLLIKLIGVLLLFDALCLYLGVRIFRRSLG
ncbi:MAG: ABC transporter permease [Nitrospirae bacterium]|nr:ABC transporter permease [Nitrospirota bacterium]